MIYCMADPHGQFQAYLDLLERIRFGDQDTMYVLGDICDKGPQPLQLLFDMMARPNIVPFMGNHDYMALYCLRFLSEDAPENEEVAFNESDLALLATWLSEGGQSTLEEFRSLSVEERVALFEYMESFRVIEEISVAEKTYVLSHAGPDNFSPERALESYDLNELIWTRLDYDKVYWPGKYLIAGHTPTKKIEGNTHPNYIYKANNHIALDCGAAYGQNLGVLCLDTDEEFYASCNTSKH